MTSNLMKVVIVRVRSKDPAEAPLEEVNYTRVRLLICFYIQGTSRPGSHKVAIKYTTYEPHYLHLFPVVAVFISTGLMPRPIVNNITNSGRDQCIGVEADDSGHPQELVAQQRTPLPVKQVIVLCLMRFAEPISFSVMIEELGVTSDTKELGYYSGLVEGVFALAQFCT
ncbi:Major Facilitator Superfamily, partial [Rhizoctonia solani]